MQMLGWLITAIGVLVAVLAPLGVLGAPTAVIMGLPSVTFWVFASVAIMGIGFVVTYFGGLKAEAELLDRAQLSGEGEAQS